MSFEDIPRGFEHPFDPVGPINHEKVTQYTEFYLSNADSVAALLNRTYDTNIEKSPEFTDHFIQRGLFVEELDADGGMLDKSFGRSNTFCAGFTLATVALDVLADELDIEPLEWRQALIQESVGAKALITIKKRGEIDPLRMNTIGRAMLFKGSVGLDSIDQCYRAMARNIESLRSKKNYHQDVFINSFGYVFVEGMSLIQKVACDKAVQVECAEVMDSLRFDAIDEE